MQTLIPNGLVSPLHWLPIVWPVTGIVMTVLGGKTVEKFSLLGSDHIRKAIHGTIGLLFIWAVVVSTSPVPLALVCLAFTAINFAILRSGSMRSMAGGETANMGTVYFPLAAFVLIVLFWSRRFPVITASMAVLALGPSLSDCHPQTDRAGTLRRHNAAGNRGIAGGCAVGRPQRGAVCVPANRQPCRLAVCRCRYPRRSERIAARQCTWRHGAGAICLSRVRKSGRETDTLRDIGNRFPRRVPVDE